MKKYKYAMVVIIVATVASYNMYFKQNEVIFSDLVMANVEALASDEGWWDSKVYNCVQDQCSFSVGFITWYGKYEKCLEGNTEAHCWECAVCDAIIGG